MSAQIVMASDLRAGDTLRFPKSRLAWKITSATPSGNKSVQVVAASPHGDASYFSFRRTTWLNVERAKLSP